MNIFLCLLFAVVFILFMLPSRAYCAMLDPLAKPEETAASLFRDKNTKSATLEVKRDGPWRLFAGKSPHSVNFSQSVLGGAQAGFFPVPVAKSVRWYFVFEQAGRRVLVAERHLPMEGGYNFRDLGGIRNADSRAVRWGMLLRADGLKKLTPADLEYLTSVPVRSLVDFRTEEESARSPDQIPPSVEYHMHYAITPGTVPPGDKLEDLYTGGVADSFMEDVNRLLVRDEGIIAIYREFFSRVQDETYLPLLFHCSAGKDRTGFAAALILFSLGVSRETVMRDYMASALYLSGKYDHIMTTHPERAALFSVKPQYLQAAINAMEEQCGSVDGYLKDVLDVDSEKMRAMFLM